MPPTDIELVDVRVVRDGRAVLADLTTRIPGGAFVAVVGENGSGKSTLLEVLAGTLPHAGRITGLPRRRGYVVQRTGAGDTLPLTARAAVEMGRWGLRGPLGRLRPDDHAAVDGALDTLGLETLQHRQLRSLSGGERQRVLVAQGLAQEAELTLLDEPTSAADAAACDRIGTAMRAHVERGRTVVVATHDRATLARADHALLLDRGRLVAQGSPHEVAEVQARRAARALLLT